MLLRLHPYYRVIQTGQTRWLVTHEIPGMPGRLAVDVDCPTRQAADKEAAWLEAEREREMARARHELALLGLHS